MYCGDEIGALVCDVGSSTCRFGYGGEDSPKGVFPTVEGVIRGGEGDGAPEARYFQGATRVFLPRENMELQSALENGLVRDWDAFERLWRFGLEDVLRVNEDGAALPILASEAPHATSEQRAKTAELLFETLQAPGVYFARTSTLAAFSAGRATACVVDLGSSGMTVAPVVDGYQLNRAVQRSPRGGDWLDERVLDILRAAETPAVPRFACKRQKIEGGGRRAVDTAALSGAKDSFRSFMARDVARDLRESVCEVPKVPLDFREIAQRLGPPREYELPDGSAVSAAPDLRILPDRLLRRTQAELKAREEAGRRGLDPSTALLHELVREAIMRSDLDCRKEMMANVLLAGGGSLLRGLPERLGHELALLVPSAFKIRVLAATSVERRYSSWIGGSIMASLGSFQQLWLSKAEYDEYGAALCEQRFL